MLAWLALQVHMRHAKGFSPVVGAFMTQQGAHLGGTEGTHATRKGLLPGVSPV
jgi:hypothetical protein